MGVAFIDLLIFFESGIYAESWTSNTALFVVSVKREWYEILLNERESPRSIRHRVILIFHEQLHVSRGLVLLA